MTSALLPPALLGGGGTDGKPATPAQVQEPHRLPADPDPITQFDGGPFQGYDCTLASGAMLARLAFGVVTDGSILRTLQDDQDGGTGLSDLLTGPVARLRRHGTHRRLPPAGTAQEPPWSGGTGP